MPAIAKAVAIHMAQKGTLVETSRSDSGEGPSQGPGASLRDTLNVPSKAQLDAAASSATAAFHRCPNLSLLIRALCDGGPAEEVHLRCRLTPGGW